jgi:hypothetical protein
MNDVLNSQDYAEAARINHILIEVWFLMILIALFGCVVQGYGVKGKVRKGLLVTILPVTISLSPALIADIDSPRPGLFAFNHKILPSSFSRCKNDIRQGCSSGFSFDDSCLDRHLLTALLRNRRRAQP